MVSGVHEDDFVTTDPVQLVSELARAKALTLVKKIWLTPSKIIHNDISANKVCNILAKENICAWDGHFYALKAIQKLNLELKGGVTRLGVSIYNTKEEIIKTVEVISKI